MFLIEWNKTGCLCQGSKPWTPAKIRKFNFWHKIVLFLDIHIHLSHPLNESRVFLGGDPDINRAVKAGLWGTDDVACRYLETGLLFRPKFLHGNSHVAWGYFNILFSSVLPENGHRKLLHVYLKQHFPAELSVWMEMSCICAVQYGSH